MSLRSLIEDEGPHPGRVLLLLLSTVAFIVTLPFGGEWPRLVTGAEGAMIAFAVVVCGTSLRHAVTALVLGTPAAILPWLAGSSTLDALSGGSAAARSLLFFYVLVLMLRRVFRTRAVTLETVLLSVASYMMTAIVWSILYGVVELVQPGSLSCFAGGVRPPEWQLDLVYFSFVTMTTLGYGDISPVAPMARSLAMLQAVTGTMFLGVLIAGLVSRLRG